MNTKPIITGRAAVPGEATGRVRIIQTSEDAHLVQEGDILVTPMTDLNMLPAMQRAAAVITDRGGVLCHAAIICREMEKTCVVGTGNASRVLAENEEVFISTAAGAGAVYQKNC
jgi:pyruvate,water dikinase